MKRTYTKKHAIQVFKFKCKRCRKERQKTIEILSPETDSDIQRKKDLIAAANQFDYICKSCKG